MERPALNGAAGSMNGEAERGVNGAARLPRGGAAAPRGSSWSPGGARAGAGAARCHLAAAVAAGGAAARPPYKSVPPRHMHTSGKLPAWSGGAGRHGRCARSRLPRSALGRAAPRRGATATPAPPRPELPPPEAALVSAPAPRYPVVPPWEVRRQDESERERAEQLRPPAGPAGRGRPAPPALGDLHFGRHPHLHHRGGPAGQPLGHPLRLPQQEAAKRGNFIHWSWQGNVHVMRGDSQLQKSKWIWVFSECRTGPFLKSVKKVFLNGEPWTSFYALKDYG
ncbi:WAS/WASL-interacting protein family member 1-like [Passer domesticus]|uniref:WAS/WASL-interacting protein family member 1-like n=1 Tax=Passer domesticus TaxID=48849 RepID=UPI0030FE198F